MARKKGVPAYGKKTKGPMTWITTAVAFVKLNAAERRTGKSKSDILTHLVLTGADGITKETFRPIDVQNAAAVAERAVG